MNKFEKDGGQNPMRQLRMDVKFSMVLMYLILLKYINILIIFKYRKRLKMITIL